MNEWKFRSRHEVNNSNGDLKVINTPFVFWSGAREDFAQIIQQRNLLRSLIARELRQRYRGSFFGWGWALVRPLVMLAIYGVVVGVFLKANRDVPQYGVYLYSGLIAWNLFSNVVSGSIASLPANTALIGKAAFRRELLVVAVACVAIVDFVIQSAVLLIGYLVYGAWPSLGSLWMALPGFISIFLFALAVGFLLSALNVYFRDIGYLTDVALQVGFWSVPILYSFTVVQSALAKVPIVYDLYLTNPLIPGLTAIRMSLWPGSNLEQSLQQANPYPDLPIVLLGISAVSCIFCFVALRLFAKMSRNMAEEL